MAYDEKKCAKDQGQTEGEVRNTWHAARDDSGVREGKDDDSFKNFTPPSSKPEDNFVGDVPLYPARVMDKLI